MDISNFNPRQIEAMLQGLQDPMQRRQLAAKLAEQGLEPPGQPPLEQVMQPQPRLQQPQRPQQGAPVPPLPQTPPRSQLNGQRGADQAFMQYIGMEGK